MIYRPEIERRRSCANGRRCRSTRRCWAARWARGCSRRSARSAACATRCTRSTTPSPTSRSCSSGSGLESAKCIEAYTRMREIVDELRDRRPDRGGGRAGPRLRRRAAGAGVREHRRRRPLRRRPLDRVRRGHRPRRGDRGARRGHLRRGRARSRRASRTSWPSPASARTRGSSRCRLGAAPAPAGPAPAPQPSATIRSIGTRARRRSPRARAPRTSCPRSASRSLGSVIIFMYMHEASRVRRDEAHVRGRHLQRVEHSRLGYDHLRGRLRSAASRPLVRAAAVPSTSPATACRPPTRARGRQGRHRWW